MNNAKMTIFDYVALSQPEKGNALLRKYRHGKVRNQKELAVALRNIAAKVGDKAMFDLAQIHPDRELLIASRSPQEFSNACGCALSIDGDGFLDEKPAPVIVEAPATKETTETTNTNTASDNSIMHMNTQNMLIIGGVILIIAAIALKTK